MFMLSVIIVNIKVFIIKLIGNIEEMTIALVFAQNFIFKLNDYCVVVVIINDHDVVLFLLMVISH